MRKKISLRKGAWRVAALLLALIIVLSGCGAGSGVQTSKIGTLATVPSTFTDRQYHISDTNNLIYVAKSGLIELYFDKVTYAVCIRETNAGKLWTALPTASEGDETAQTALLTVTVSGGGKQYVLNSQDNSVAFGAASFKPLTNGIQVTYDMALDSETANSALDLVAAGNLYVSATITYTLEDGAMHATVDCSQLLASAGFTVESVTMLDFFGASVSGAAGDYMFVPDGSGAVEMTAGDYEGDYPSKTFVTYGEDPALGEKAAGDTVSSVPSVIPAYGVKSGTSAFVALVETGAEISSITETRRQGNGTYNRVGPTFRVTDTAYSGDEGKVKQYVGTPYTGELGICYRFLSDKNASYSGMAAACRELLIRSGLLSTKMVSNSDYLPFLLTIEASAAKKNANNTEVLTDYEEALELLRQMKAKSVNNIFVRYNGVLDGANAQGLLKSSDPQGKLGSEKEFQSLAQYASTQQFTLFLNLDLFTFHKKSASISGNAADNIYGKSASFTEENVFAGYLGEETQTRWFLKLSDLEENIYEFLEDTRDYTVGGYCIDDAGRFLYSDYSDQPYSRISAESLLVQQVPALASGHKLMVDTGNIYMLSNADVVADLPSETGYPETETYSAVPFMQMILHGIVEYAQTPINLSENSEKAFLKSVEYGALPSYDWSYRKTGVESVDTLYNYESQITKAAENYAKADAALKDLRSARMTSHYEVQDGVYCTEYNNSVLLYFNYNDTAVTVNSITIEPMSFLRVN